MIALGLENYHKQCSHTLSQAKNVKVISGDKRTIFCFSFTLSFSLFRSFFNLVEKGRSTVWVQDDLKLSQKYLFPVQGSATSKNETQDNIFWENTKEKVVYFVFFTRKHLCKFACIDNWSKIFQA